MITKFGVNDNDEKPRQNGRVYIWLSCCNVLNLWANWWNQSYWFVSVFKISREFYLEHIANVFQREYDTQINWKWIYLVKLPRIQLGYNQNTEKLFSEYSSLCSAHSNPDMHVHCVSLKWVWDTSECVHLFAVLLISFVQFSVSLLSFSTRMFVMCSHSRIQNIQ